MIDEDTRHTIIRVKIRQLTTDDETTPILRLVVNGVLIGYRSRSQ